MINVIKKIKNHIDFSVQNRKIFEQFFENCIEKRGFSFRQPPKVKKKHFFGGGWRSLKVLVIQEVFDLLYNSIQQYLQFSEKVGEKCYFGT
ncbi:MAG: hypothetical protein ACUVQP_09550 [Bacteroidales bacterium]